MVVHVRAGADATVADGSPTHPYATLDQGITHAGDGGWVLVAAGQYHESITHSRGSVHVLGLCAALVELHALGEASVTAENAGTQLDLRGATILGEGVGIRARDGAFARVSGVVVAAASNVGVGALRNARIELADSIIRDTRRVADTNGSGLLVLDRGSIRATAVVVEQSAYTGVAASGVSTRLQIDSSVIRGSGFGGIGALDGAVVDVAGSIVEDNVAPAAHACSCEGSPTSQACTCGTASPHLALSRSVVRRTYAIPTTSRVGLRADGHATMSLEDVLIETADGAGVHAWHPGSRVTLTRAVIRNTSGVGILSDDGGEVTSVGSIVEGSTAAGVAAIGEGSQAEFISGVVRGTRHHSERLGRGISADRGATLRAREVLLTDNAGEASAVVGVDARVEIERSVVRCASDGSGSGLVAADGATLIASGVLVANCALDGVRVGQNESDGGADAAPVDVVPPRTRAELADMIVRGTHPNRDGGLGRGLNLFNRASVVGTCLLIEDTTGNGIFVDQPETEAEITQTVVRTTGVRRDASGGAGLQVQRGAVVRAEGLRVARSTVAGVVVANEGTRLSLFRSVVSDTFPGPFEWGGVGIQVSDGAAFEADGLAVEGNALIGIGVYNPPTRTVLNAVAVRRTFRHRTGTFGRGLSVANGALVQARGVLVVDNTEMGIVAATGARAELDDVLVLDTAPSVRGFGMGIYTAARASLTGTRVALQSLHGAGVASVPFQNNSGARVELVDLFVRDVQPSTVEFNDDRTQAPVGVLAAYGLYAGPDCAISVSRGVIDRCDLGFFNASGTVQIRQGAITHQRRGAGGNDAVMSAASTRLEDVALRDNARNLVESRPGLPRVAAYPSPSAVAPLDTM